MNQSELKQLYPQLSTVDPRLLSILTGKKQQGGGALSSVQPTSFTTDSASAPRAGYPSWASSNQTNDMASFMPNTSDTGFNALASAGLKALSPFSGGLSNPYNLKKGGKVKARQGALHIPEFKTGTTGHFVQGRGDGQSDDIPAMLADGEYVFDADTVAALGNGSSKAGAEILDKMRQNIRKHKRSAPEDKIPPKAKSPLEYLKG